jgi:hypothetical protein
MDYFDLVFLGGEEESNATWDVALIKLLSYHQGGHKGQKDAIFIGHECATLTELESQIDRLQKDLEEVRKIARNKFQKHQ